MKRLAMTIASVAAVGMLAFSSQAVGGPNGSENGTMCVQNTKLRPGNEVRTPPVTDPVTSTARGRAQIKVRNDGTIEYKVFILNKAGERFFAGHIHEGLATQNGPVRVTLFSVPMREAVGSRRIRLRGELTASQTTSANFAPADVCTNPSRHYVNFHTTDDPQGAVRGQL